jgi:RNA polymerase sigma-70 factor (ECF subfamily)
MNTSASLTRGVLAGEPRPAEPPSDELLAARGDAAGFAELYERYAPAVYRYACARLSSRTEAEDVTSESFRQVWSSRHRYRGHGTFRAWLFSIVRRAIADHYRRRRRVTPLAPALAEQMLDDAPSPEDRVVQDERERYARRLLGELTQEQQEILSLRFAAELTYAEIAAVLGKREDAVKKIAYRSLQLLRERNIHA